MRGTGCFCGSRSTVWTQALNNSLSNLNYNYSRVKRVLNVEIPKFIIRIRIGRSPFIDAHTHIRSQRHVSIDEFFIFRIFGKCSFLRSKKQTEEKVFASRDNQEIVSSAFCVKFSLFVYQILRIVFDHIWIRIVYWPHTRTQSPYIEMKRDRKIGTKGANLWILIS